MTKKNNETRLIALALTVVVTVISVIVIVMGIVARRNGGEEKPGDGKETETHETEPPKPSRPNEPTDTSRLPDPIKPLPNETEPPETEDVFVPDDTDAEDVMTEPKLPEFVAPARGEISKGHSETVLVYSLTTDDYRTHSGVDIAGNIGDIVVSAADGYVKSVYEDPMWGTCVSIVHEGDATSYYMNLAKDSTGDIAVGDKVSAGDVIGAVGESAIIELADEPHLHFELKIDGVSVDPEDYFDETPGGVYEY